MSPPPTNPVAGALPAPPCLSSEGMRDADAAEVDAPADPRDWFRDQIHAHDRQLRGWLQRQFPKVRDIEDLVQESYLRVWRRHLERPVDSAKAFLFRVARHLAIDDLRRRRTATTESLGDLADLPVMVEAPDAAESLCYEEKIELLAAAFLKLPARCRTIMTLRKLKGQSVRDIAATLAITEGTVDHQITRGTHLLRAYLEGKGVRSFDRD